MFSTSACHSQNGNNEKSHITRKPAFAGQFYAANPDTLRADLKTFFSTAVSRQYDNVIAIITPHAGYVFSGKTAACAYNQIDTKKRYKNIFVIGSSHRVSFDGASVYYLGNYSTPLGEVKVNTTLAKELVDNNGCFTYRQDADAPEHSVEVQLPFLQYLLGNSFQIVPIVIATNSLATIDKISAALKPYFNADNLFVISTDFSHYPTYEIAQKVDKLTVESILKNKAEDLIEQISYFEKHKVPGLATSLCGWTSVITLLKMSENYPNISAHLIKQTNSGDTEYGEKDRVVGYAAIAFTTDSKATKAENSDATKASYDYNLTSKDKDILLALVKKTLANYIPGKRIDSLKSNDFPEALHAPLGVFVTLHKNNALRGCIGRFYTDDPLYKTVQEMAIAAATEDTRFKPVCISELKDITIEISVLSLMKRIYKPDEIVLGKHGIYIKKDNRSGTFLPQVATETGWDVEDFLGHCSQDKAGLGWDGWKDAELYVYTALVFGEK